MRAWILVGSLAAAAGAAACGTQAASPLGAAGQTALRCEPGQHAVVNQAVIDGGTVTSVSCAADLAAPIAAATPGPSYSQLRSQPAAYAPAPVAYASVPVVQPAVVRDEPVREEAPARVVVPQRKPRSWQQRAIVIGGSSGAGAGLGALIGGKKGALIGAAIGGGAGTIYEMQKK